MPVCKCSTYATILYDARVRVSVYAIFSARKFFLKI